jgi:hypothetical protein
MISDFPEYFKNSYQANNTSHSYDEFSILQIPAIEGYEP